MEVTIAPEETLTPGEEQIVMGIRKEEEIREEEIRIPEIFEISSNWKIVGSKILGDTVTTVLHQDFSGSMTLDDIAYENTSVEIQPVDESEPCTVDIRMKNGRKIVRMGISSEASVLEIFKESGEYATTIFSEFIDEFEGCTVYLGGVVFDKPTHEASVKFTRVKNERKSLYIYGIRLVLEDADPSEDPAHEKLNYTSLITEFMTLMHPRKNDGDKTSSNCGSKPPPSVSDPAMTEYFKKIVGRLPQPPMRIWNGKELEEILENGGDDCGTGRLDNNNESPKEEENQVCSENFRGNPDLSGLEELIEMKFRKLESRLMDRIDRVEKNTNERLGEILKKLDDLRT